MVINMFSKKRSLLIDNVYFFDSLPQMNVSKARLALVDDNYHLFKKGNGKDDKGVFEDYLFGHVLYVELFESNKVMLKIISESESNNTIILLDITDYFKLAEYYRNGSIYLNRLATVKKKLDSDIESCEEKISDDIWAKYCDTIDEKCLLPGNYMIDLEAIIYHFMKKTIPGHYLLYNERFFMSKYAMDIDDLLNNNEMVMLRDEDDKFIQTAIEGYRLLKTLSQNISIYSKSKDDNICLFIAYIMLRTKKYNEIVDKWNLRFENKSPFEFNVADKHWDELAKEFIDLSTDNRLIDYQLEEYYIYLVYGLKITMPKDINESLEVLRNKVNELVLSN